MNKPRLESEQQQQHEERIAFPSQGSKLELSRKDQQYFNFTAAVQLLVDEGQADTTALQELSIKPFLSLLLLLVISYCMQ